MIRITNSRQHWFDLTLSLSVLGISRIFLFFPEMFGCFFFPFCCPGLQLERFPLLEKLPLFFWLILGLIKPQRGILGVTRPVTFPEMLLCFQRFKK